MMQRSSASVVLMIVLTGLASSVRGDDWPQWGGPQRDGVWRETGILDAFPADGLKVRWRQPLGAGYTGPAVANGRVYVTDRPRRTQTERVLCLDERTGKPIWTHTYASRYQGINRNSGPRATPTVADGKVYTIGTMGDLFCFDAATGKIVWKKNFVDDFGTNVPMWGMSAGALVDGERLICLVGGADGAGVVAFHKDTGKEIWRSLSLKDPGYCPPVIFEVGETRQLIIWHPEAVVSLNPETGKSHWTVPFKVNSNLTIPTPVLEGDRLFLTAFYDGPFMLKLAQDRPAANLLWRGKSRSEKPRQTDGLHSIMATPVMRDGHVYGVCSYGMMRCLDATTGRRVWNTFDFTGEGRWWNAFLIPQRDRYFIANEQGELIIARLNPDGHKIISRTQLIEPTGAERGRQIVWSHPAFANRHVFARNDKEIICASLAADQTASAVD